MELWTEYEGRTIDGAFPLKRLLRPEGRSAFFSTSNGAGTATVIRLIESHFDEEEILARWRGVEALRHPNLLKLEKFGQLEMDGTTVIYAVMEPVEANLADVVSRQRLTVAEAKQLAASLISAVDVLHTHGFVHEHVEPSNIFAVGDVVKLRSDCIREAPEGEQGLKAKRRDLHDIAVVLLQGLTQERTLEAAVRDLPLPSPFDQIVRQTMSGAWGVAEIKAALPTAKRASTPSAPMVLAPVRAASEPQPLRSNGHASVAPSASGAAATTRLPLFDPAPIEPAASADEAHDEQSFADRSYLDEPEESRSGPGMRLLVAAGVAVLVILLIVWHFASSPVARDKNATQQITAKPALASSPNASTSAPATTANASGATPHPAPSISAAGTHEVWRVVAFTYKHQQQAQKKADAVAQKHPGWRPEVFTPNGHAPYLVTVGGAMSKQEAFTLAKKSRSLGLPRDTYAQNYSGKGK